LKKYMGPWTGTVVCFFSGIAQKSRGKKKGRGIRRKKKKDVGAVVSPPTHTSPGEGGMTS
jgi:hypothetical protein